MLTVDFLFQYSLLGHSTSSGLTSEAFTHFPNEHWWNFTFITSFFDQICVKLSIWKPLMKKFSILLLTEHKKLYKFCFSQQNITEDFPKHQSHIAEGCGMESNKWLDPRKYCIAEHKTLPMFIADMCECSYKISLKSVMAERGLPHHLTWNDPNYSII